MNKNNSTFIIISLLNVLSAIIITLLSLQYAHAQPYGKGIYNANVPYGDETSLSIATDGNVTIPITPTSAGVSASGNNIVTVTSTDVKGYKLYIRALNNTDMTNFGAALPTSANGSPATLATNTWGYNTDGSANFVGMTLTDVLIKSVTIPVSTGDNTTVTYGIKLDLAKPAGNYTTTIIYTAVPQTD